MRAPTLTPNDREEQDAAHNPGQQHADEQFNEITHGHKSTADELKELENYANDPLGVGEIEKYANKSSGDTKESGNNTSVKDEEEKGGPINYTGSGKQRKEPYKFQASDWVKKRGPMTAIVAMIFGGGGLLGVFVAPGLGIIQAKEAFMKDLNDQVAAMDITSDHLLRAKLKGLQAGGSVCGNVVTIRCKFGTMSKPQVQAFKAAGFVIEPEGDGRVKPTSITFPPDDDGNPGRRITNPNELADHTRGNFTARRQLSQGFSPRFSGMTDKLANAVLLKLRIDKSPKIPSTTKVEDQEKAVTNASQGIKGQINPQGYDTDKDGRKFVVDASGNKIFEDENPDKFKEVVENNLELNDRISEQMGGETSAGGRFLSTVANSVRLTGGIDTACTIYNVSRAMAAAAKVARGLQMAQWSAAMVNTPGDQFMAGDGTQEVATFIGNSFSAADTNKTISDNTTIKGVDNNGNIVYEQKPNPDYGKTFWDSRGYKLAAYNNSLDAKSPLTAREQQFTTGGGLTGNLTGVLDTITSTLGLGNGAAARKAIRGVCSVVQSWWVRTIGLVAGLVSAVGTFGGSAAANVAISVAVGFAMPFLQAQLADILAGKTVSGKTKGVDAGNAGFVGTSHALGKIAAGRGMVPSNIKTQKDYEVVGKRVKDDYIAIDTYEARKTPFDIKNEYSFLGSLMRKVNPVLLKSNASISGALISIPSLLGTAVSSMVPFASAAEVFNEERFKQCHDQGYFEVNIDADVFCNVRYIMTNKQLGMEPEAAAIYMETNGHIEPDGTPKSDAYKRWLKACTEREDGHGETSNEEPTDYDAEIGKICTDVSEENDNFVVLTISKTVEDAMSTPPDAQQSAWWSGTDISVASMESSQ